MEERIITQVEHGVDAERWITSTCGICSVGCGVEVGVSGKTIVGIRGRRDHPVKRGRLGPKGLNQWYANRHPTRALHPLIRSGSRLLQASWDDAMNLMVDRFNEAMATDGPDGVAIYNSGQLLLEEKFAVVRMERQGIRCVVSELVAPRVRVDSAAALAAMSVGEVRRRLRLDTDLSVTAGDYASFPAWELVSWSIWVVHAALLFGLLWLGKKALAL